MTKAGVRNRPYSLRRRVRRRSHSFCPSDNAEGVERRVAHQSSVLPRSLLRTRAPLGAPSRLRAPGFRQRHRPRVRASWDEACANPSPASSSRRGPNAPRSVPGPPGSGGTYVLARGRRTNRRFPAGPLRRGAASPALGPIVAPSSRRLAKTPSAEPGGRKDARSMWRKYGIYSYISTSLSLPGKRRQRVRAKRGPMTGSAPSLRHLTWQSISPRLHPQVVMRLA